MPNRPTQAEPLHRLPAVVTTSILLLVTVLGVVALVLILPYLELSAVSAHITQVMVFALFVVLAMAFPVKLTYNTIGISHVITMTAFLGLPLAVYPLLVFSVGIGSFFGSLFLQRFGQRRSRHGAVTTLLIAGARGGTVAFSLVVSAQLFINLGGIPPVTTVPSVTASFSQLAIFLLVNTGLYGMLTAAVLLAEGINLRTLMSDSVRASLALLLPVPLAILGGQITSSLSGVSQWIMYLTAGFIILFFSGLSLAEIRLLADETVQSRLTDENTKLIRSQETRIEQMRLLNQVTSTLGATLSTNRLLDHIVSSVSMLTPASGIALHLQEGNALTLVQTANLDDLYVRLAPKPISAGNIANSPAPLFIRNIRSDLRATSIVALLGETSFISLVEVPLVTAGEALGILSLFYDRDHHIDDSQVEVLRAFGNLAAQTLWNSYQYGVIDQNFRRSSERLYRLASLSERLSENQDLVWRAQLVLSEVMQVAGAECGLICLTNASGIPVELGAVEGLSETEPQLLRHAAEILDSMVLTGGTVELRRGQPLAMDSIFFIQSTQSALFIPLMQHDEPFGLIWLETSAPNGYMPDDIQFAEQVGQHAIIALRNARLFEELELDRDRLSALLDTLIEGIMLVNQQGDIIVANPRMRLVGLNHEDLISRNLLAMLATDTLALAASLGFSSSEDVEEFVSKLEMTSEFEPSEFTIFIGGSARYIERRVVPVTEADGRSIGAMLVFYDRTEQHELEHSREELTQMIVHDLRSPLTAITTSLRLIRDLVPKTSPQYPAVETTADISNQAIRKILSRVNSILDVAKLRTEGIRLDQLSTTLDQIVTPVLNELEPIASDLGIGLKYENEEHAPVGVTVDVDKLERVLLNLVDNALKHSPSDTQITVRQNPVSPHVGYVRVDVIDQGPGIPEEYKNRLFDSYIQIEGRRGRRGGVGLGLTFCKLVIEAHGGTIWIEDNPGGGSVFAFTIPESISTNGGTAS